MGLFSWSLITTISPTFSSSPGLFCPVLWTENGGFSLTTLPVTSCSCVFILTKWWENRQRKKQQQWGCASHPWDHNSWDERKRFPSLRVQVLAQSPLPYLCCYYHEIAWELGWKKRGKGKNNGEVFSSLWSHKGPFSWSSDQKGRDSLGTFSDLTQ